MCKRTALLVAAVLGMIVSANVALADGVRSATAKILGDYGDRPTATMNRTRTVYRAEAPTATRSFSYDAAQQPEANAPCPAATTPSAPAQPAQRSPTAQRRFSYEPAMPTYAPPRSFRSGTPAYLLPKTDPRKFRGF